MSNCTISLLQVSKDKKEQVLQFLQENVTKKSPYLYDNWGLYPYCSEHLKPNQTSIRIGFIETEDTFMIRASHPNYVPKEYLEFAKSIEARLLFQDIDSYGENRVAWDLTDESTNMSDAKYVFEFVKHYDNYTPFTAEFLKIPVVQEN